MRLSIQLAILSSTVSFHRVIPLEDSADLCSQPLQGRVREAADRNNPKGITNPNGWSHRAASEYTPTHGFQKIRGKVVGLTGLQTGTTANFIG
jgi:hypothetical protein